MDTTTNINRLRAQFFWECPEKDLMRRIIKPYTIDKEQMFKINQKNYDQLNGKIKRVYIAPNGEDILQDLESPPISESYMENYKGSSTRTQSKKGKTGVKKSMSAHNNIQSESKDNEQYGKTNSVESTLKVENVPWKVENDAKLQEDVPTLHGFRNGGSLDFHGSSIKAESSDSDSNDVKKKTGRKLPFSRIFKGRKDSDDTLKKATDKKKARLTNRNKKHIAFDMNFDYDKNLDEDDDDDEDDDGEGLQSAFFKLDSEQSKSDGQNAANDKDNQFDLEASSNSLITTNTNGNSNGNNNNNNNINNNVTFGTNTNSNHNNNSNNNNGNSTNNANNSANVNLRKKNHFPQNIIPRNPLLDSTKNNSFKSERLAKGSNHDDSISNISKKRTAGQDEYISDMESLINEKDLDRLDLDNVPSNTERSSSSKQLEAIDASNDDISNGEQIILNEEQDSDSISSYGRSLLDSDFSTENDLNKEGTSGLESVSMLDSSDVMPGTISHSIPKTLGDYGLYHGQDDSTIDDAFDSAVQKIKSSDKISPSKEKRSSNQSVPHSLLNRRLSSNSNTGGGKTRSHTRSSSSASANNGKLKSDSNKQHIAISSKQERPSVTSIRSEVKMNSLIIHKISDFKRPTTSDSQLSSLFNRRKLDPENPTDVLEYFSFVSGSKVPKYEAEKLNVYIEGSRKYKHVPFKLNVRKSATVFETIGYVLYMYSREHKNDDAKDDGLPIAMLQNPNKFCLKIVDEDGEPFEDNFGKLNRSKLIKQLSDDEVVLCTVDQKEMDENDKETPLPYNLAGEILNKTDTSASKDDVSSSRINQLSYYRPILGNDDDANQTKNTKVIDVKVFMYPSTNKQFNFTTISVLITSSINDILVKYCKMKSVDPNDYILKLPGSKLAYNLNDTVLRLDANNEVEIISKRDARKLKVQKAMPDIAKPTLPTIQSNDLTPLTLEPLNAYLQPVDGEKQQNVVKESKPPSKLKKLGSKHRLGLTTQISGSSNTSGVNTPSGFFKNKNSSKSSLHGSLQYYTPNRSSLNVIGNGTGTYQDLFSGAYHKYKVWRRQQMSLMNKHERALALDGDYIYIVPPEKQLHWHENVKTKSIHISQVVLIKRSKRVPEYFKLFFKKGQHEMKRYYFEAVSPEECNEIVSRIQSSVSAYRMNHK
ncbi:hypothetical protein HG535_0H02990 [Zygotorulaspora mrakii]|uniref:Uncharacterized protein n=1 Tax=Zygotorulaspora mrakii TaxID=42260 RepID=A0A7H9BB46_ZYGMR|nr:uncharacterized protein HG535_0H02990 [Zygotorulaspora mrakii]QLG74972.1 hypothetical protein HG535_0H02990 [Zygotorulaspora mrakii]